MGHCHYWKIGEITNGVATGVCKCGEVKTFDATGDKSSIQAVSQINAAGRRKLGLAAPKRDLPPRKPKARGIVAHSNGVAPLPAFSNEWQPAVQIKWLEVYAQLHQK